MGKRQFCINEFKDWLSKQKDLSEFFNITEEEVKTKYDFVDKEVSSKVGMKKLLERINPKEGDAEVLVEDLIENGGVIRGAKGKDLLIEVSSGSFYIPRFCIKILD